MDGMLSQEEINALLAGANVDGLADANTDGEETLTDEQKDAIGEISNISMGTAATTLSTLLNQTVNITTPKVTYMNWQELADSYDKPCVFLQISYTAGLEGNNVLVLKERDVKIITDLMMGGPGNVSDEPIGELHLSAIGEAMNQMMGSAATSMSSMLGKKIDISPPVANLVDLNDSNKKDIPEFLEKRFVKVSFRMTIGTLIDSEIMQQYPGITQAALISSDYHLPWASILFQTQFILDGASVSLVSNAAYPTSTRLYGASLLRYQANGILEIASRHS